MPIDPIWIPALSGGLAGALLTLFGQSAVRWWNRPILSIVFREEPGCSVPMDGWMVNKSSGEPLLDPARNPRRAKMHYLRLRIENRGNTFAKNISVCVTQISCRASGTGDKSFAEEVFELSVAQTAGNTLVFNLPSGGHRFIDFVHTSLDDTNCLELIFDFGKATHRLASLNFGSGRYKVKVFASAENAASLAHDLHWSFGGSVDSLKILDCA
jgi:hypothetical protein